MNQEQKQLVLPGPYQVDQTTTGVFTVRGEGHAAVAKCAVGIYNRKEVTTIRPLQARAHIQLVLEAFKVLALSGKSPMEMHLELISRK